MFAARLRDQPRGHRLQARRRAVSLGAHQGLAQGEMRLRPGVRHHRLAAVRREGAAVLVASSSACARATASVYRGRVGSGFGERELDELWPELAKARGEDAAGRRCARDVRRERAFRQAGAGRRDRLSRLHRRGHTSARAAIRAFARTSRQSRLSPKCPIDPPDATPGKRSRARPVGKEEVAVPKPSAVITVDSTKHDKAIEIEGVRVTHPDKVVFPGNGITKRQLIEYYLAGQGPHPAARRRPAAVASYAAPTAPTATASSRSTPRPVFPTPSSRSASRRRRGATSISISRTSAA